MIENNDAARLDLDARRSATERLRVIEQEAQTRVFADLMLTLEGGAPARNVGPLLLAVADRFHTSEFAEHFAAFGSEHVSMLLQTWLDRDGASVFGPLEDRADHWRRRGQNERQAQRVAMARARRLLPWALVRLFQHLTLTHSVHTALQRQYNAAAHRFAERTLKAQRRTADPSAIADLARRLVVQDLDAGDITAEQMAAAAKVNPLLRELWEQEPKGTDPERTWELGFAYHWPAVIRRWQEDQRNARTSEFKFPTALVAGDGAPGKFFGGTKPGEVTHSRGRVIVRQGGTQLTLFSHLFPSAQKDADLMRQVDSLLGNRAFRVLLACFSAAQDDLQDGRAPAAGDFFYSPTRMANALGFPMEKNGAKGMRQPKPVRKAMDEALAELMHATITGTFKAGGSPRELKVEGLIVDQGVTLGATKATRTGPGRKPERLLRISPGLLGMLENGAAYFHMDAKALRPPKGIDQRTWDDAFKVFAVLAARARLSPTKAKPGATLPWERKVETLLSDANIMSRGQVTRNARARLLGKLLPALREGGFLAFEADSERIRYDVPTIRPELPPLAERIEHSKGVAAALPAGAVAAASRRSAGRKPKRSPHL